MGKSIEGHADFRAEELDEESLVSERPTGWPRPEWSDGCRAVWSMGRALWAIAHFWPIPGPTRFAM
jgi:hypothetical protein